MSTWGEMRKRSAGETVRKENQSPVFFEIKSTYCSHCYNDDFGPGEDIVLYLKNQEDEILGVELYVEGEEYTDGNGIKFFNSILDGLKQEYSNLFLEVTYDEEGEPVYHLTKIVREMLVEFNKRMKINKIYSFGFSNEYGMYDEQGNYYESGELVIH